MGNYLGLPTFETTIEEIESSIEKKYGWKPDKVDHRDHLYQLHNDIDNRILPSTVDLRSLCPDVYDQGKLGSCTANAIGGAYQFDEIRQHNHDQFVPSRLFIYYNEREMEGTVNEDSGAEIRDGIKSIATLGVCDEKIWPYDISQFKVKPCGKAYNNAQNHHGVKYHRLSQSIDELRHCLSNGYPFVFGFAVYQSFESERVARTGYMNMPLSNDKFLGGHAVMAVGYTDDYFIIRNSWGSSWGDKGYFYMPNAYILNPKLCSDFWTLQKVTQE